MDIIVQEQYYKAVVESATTAILFFDTHGQVQLSNSIGKGDNKRAQKKK